jgi:pimeloyl-ACP methyl ester carboxylesterase
MTHNQEPIMTQAVSRDGTHIGYFSSGEGPPLLLVHGLLGDHTRWDALRPYLEPHFTVHAMDRRGQGASGDAPVYAFEREVEDATVVIDAVAKMSQAAVNILGSSGGALYALGASVKTPNIRRLVLFEPPPTDVAQLLPEGLLERLDTLLTEGDREGVLMEAYRAIVGLSDDEIDHLRSQPTWPNRIAAAHTVPRELRLAPDKTIPLEQVKRITAPTLVLAGSETPRPYRDSAEAVAAALPNAQRVILEGQGHGAEMFAPELVSEPIIAFLHEQP